MIRGIYLGEKGMVVQQRNQEVISTNLANANTPGYKGQMTVFDTFADRLMERVNGGTGQREEIGLVNLDGVQAQVVTDWRPGQITESGRNQDLALASPGFFTLETTEGTRYSRLGPFGQDTNGYLVNSDGYYLLGERGRLRVEGKWQVQPDGSVIVNGRMIDRLLISNFTGLDQLIREDRGIWSAPTGLAGYQLERPVVRQGFIEQSNLDASGETVKMLAAVRSYEASQQVIQAHDRLLDLAVNRVGSLR